MKKTRIILSLMLVVLFGLSGCSANNLNIDNQLKKANSVTYDSNIMNEDFSSCFNSKNTIVNYQKVDTGTDIDSNVLPVGNMFNKPIEDKTIQMFNFDWAIANLQDSEDYQPSVILLDAKLRDYKDFNKSREDISNIFNNVIDNYKGFMYKQNIQAFSEEALQDTPIVLITKISGDFNYYITFEAGYTKELKQYYMKIFIIDADATLKLYINDQYRDIVNSFAARMKSVNQNFSLKTADNDAVMGYIISENKGESKESPEEKIIKNKIIYTN